MGQCSVHSVQCAVIFLFCLQAACFAQIKGDAQVPPVSQKQTEEQASSNTWDFGRVEEGQIVKHSFIFRNETQRVLNISEIHTSCGCTASQVKKKNLLPGEETFIEVSFNSKGYKGSVQQFVYVNTDSLDASTSLGINGQRSRTIDNPIIRYIIKADVYKTLPAAGMTDKSQ